MMSRFALLLSLAWVGCGPLPKNEPAMPAAPAAQPVAEPVAGEPVAAPAAADPSATAPGPQISAKGVRFNYKPSGKPSEIFLAGTFNAWNPANKDYLLKDEDGDGVYSITLQLAPGTYQYKFVIDGTWTKDPYSPEATGDGFGGQNGKFAVP